MGIIDQNLCIFLQLNPNELHDELPFTLVVGLFDVYFYFRSTGTKRYSGPN